jgi:hypothetical protein
MSLMLTFHGEPSCNVCVIIDVKCGRKRGLRASPFLRPTGSIAVAFAEAGGEAEEELDAFELGEPFAGDSAG